MLFKFVIVVSAAVLCTILVIELVKNRKRSRNRFDYHDRYICKKMKP